MSTYSTRFTKGRINTAEYEVYAVPNVAPTRPQRPIIFAHGYTSVHAADGPVIQGNYGKIFNALASLGSVVVSADFAGNSWGNDTVAARVETARALAVSAYGAKDDKAVVVGFSMGFLTGYGYARQNPTKIAGLFGVAPASNVQDIKTNNRVDNTSINTAYSIATGAAIPARYDPTQTPATLSGVPGQLFYGTADATIIPSTVTALATALGWTATVIDTTNAHMSDAQLAGVPLTGTSGLPALVAALL